MHLTPEQREQIRQAKASGASRVMLGFAGTQQATWSSTVTDELAAKEENMERFLKIKQASEQTGFFGDIRRAILLSRIPVDELSAKIGVDSRSFSDFRAGEAELPAIALDRLVEALGLRLMHEIPRP